VESRAHADLGDLTSGHVHELLHRVSTKNDLLASWCKWTGDDLPEARHRIRALSEDGLLPVRSYPINYDDLARALLGFVVTAQHKDAAAEVRAFSEFRCGLAEPGHDGSAPHMGLTLLDAIAAALHRPFMISEFQVNTTTRYCLVKIINGWRFEDVFNNGEKHFIPGSEATYHFHDVTTLPLPRTTYPINLLRRLDTSAIHHLLVDLFNHPDRETEDAAPARAAPSADPSMTCPKADAADRTSLNNSVSIARVDVSANPFPWSAHPCPTKEYPSA
jgi:hypothetical protein